VASERERPAVGHERDLGREHVDGWIRPFDLGSCGPQCCRGYGAGRVRCDPASGNLADDRRLSSLGDELAFELCEQRRFESGDVYAASGRCAAAASSFGDVMSLRIESDRVAFDLADGKHLKLPSSYGTIHDQAGAVLPRCVVFFGPFKKTRKRVEMDRAERRYFGSDHRAVLAELPKIPKEGWKRVGEVVMIYYVRRGSRAPGGFHHPFKTRHPVLYKQERLYKLDLGENCIVDDRGYVFP